MEDWGGPIRVRDDGGRAVVALLKAEQVRHIFGIVGGTFLDVLDALYDDKSVEYVYVRHEQGGGVHGRRPGADHGDAGGVPGDRRTRGHQPAHGDRRGVRAHSPVVAIAGGPRLGHYYKDTFQEFDLVGMFKPVTKLSIQVNKPDRIPEILHFALRSATTGRKGPVFVDIPQDVLNDQVVRTEVGPPASYRPSHPQSPHPDAVWEAVRWLRQAERPLLLVGGGVTWAKANELVAQVSTRHALDGRCNRFGALSIAAALAKRPIHFRNSNAIQGRKCRHTAHLE